MILLSSAATKKAPAQIFFCTGSLRSCKLRILLRVKGDWAG